MSLFLIALRESLEYALILFLLAGVYEDRRKTLIVSAVVIVAAGFLITALNFPLSAFMRKTYTGFLFYSFVMVLFLAFVSGRKVIYPVLALAFTLLIPSAELASVVMEEVRLKGHALYLPPLLGLLAGAGLFAASSNVSTRFRIKRFFGGDGVMVFIASFCFIFGGLHEFDDTSLVTSLQKGLSVFLSSWMPFFKELLLVPNGKSLTAPLNDVFDYLSSQRVAMAITAVILFLPPLIVFLRLLFTPEPDTDGIEKRAEKRKIIAVYINELIRKGIPLILALLASVTLLHAANLAIRPTYEPEPVPVMAEADVITIPLVDKFGDVSDGKMRKYSFLYQGETYRFFVILRPDGEVVAVLDACQVCPPRGYVQRADHVVCKYCNTPMPTLSVGQPGGCNPIPVRYRVESDALILKQSDIVEAFQKEAGKETGSALR